MVLESFNWYFTANKKVSSMLFTVENMTGNQVFSILFDSISSTILQPAAAQLNLIKLTVSLPYRKLKSLHV